MDENCVCIYVPGNLYPRKDKLPPGKFLQQTLQLSNCSKHFQLDILLSIMFKTEVIVTSSLPTSSTVLCLNEWSYKPSRNCPGIWTPSYISPRSYNQSKSYGLSSKYFSIPSPSLVLTEISRRWAFHVTHGHQPHLCEGYIWPCLYSNYSVQSPTHCPEYKFQALIKTYKALNYRADQIFLFLSLCLYCIFQQENPP